MSSIFYYIGVLSIETSHYIIERLDVTINCSGPVMLDEDDDFKCECRNEGGNPPVSLTWYKDKKQISELTYWGENTLYLIDVNVKDSGTYTCVAQSKNTLEKDEKSIQITVYCEYLYYALCF